MQLIGASVGDVTRFEQNDLRDNEEEKNRRNDDDGHRDPATPVTPC